MCFAMHVHSKSSSREQLCVRRINFGLCDFYEKCNIPAKLLRNHCKRSMTGRGRFINLQLLEKGLRQPAPFLDQSKRTRAFSGLIVSKTFSLPL